MGGYKNQTNPYQVNACKISYLEMQEVLNMHKAWMGEMFCMKVVAVNYINILNPSGNFT
jgi:hypothetical protein